MKKFYTVSYMLLFALTLVSLVIAAIASAGILLRMAAISGVIVFSLLQAVCLSLYRGAGRSISYRIGFALLHMGLLCFIGGSFVFIIAGEKATAAVPVGDGVYYTEIMRDDGSVADFGFSVSVVSFTVEKYKDTGLDREYNAVLSIGEDGAVPKEANLRVNHTVRCNGWKIYLMSYSDGSGSEFVTLLFKRDPAEFITTAGCVFVIAGAFAMCLLPQVPRSRKREEKEAAV